MKRLVFLFLFSLFLISCSKDISEQNYRLPTLTGEWNWIESSGGFIIQIYTPETTGEIRKIEFTSDSVFRRFINGKLNLECRYHLINLHRNNSDSTLWIKYDSLLLLQGYIFFSWDTLALYDHCSDCYEHLYTRLK